ncbi:MAG: hypothetical protein ABL955_11480, partial [Elusimicrobiota bacterium]
MAALAAVTACREPSGNVSLDLAPAHPKMAWSHNPGLPVGEARAGLTMVLQPTDRIVVTYGGTPTKQTLSWAFSLRNDAWSTLML